MRRILKTAVVTAILFIGATAAAFANEVSVTFVSANGHVQGGYATGPYHGYIVDDGHKYNTDLFCDDIMHSWGTTWDASVYSFDNLTGTRFYSLFGSNAMQDYGEMAWLSEQMLKYPDQAGDIQFAIWSIPHPAVIGWDGYTAVSASWRALAAERTYTPEMFRNLEILTPLDPSVHSPQEMIIPQPTPEPTSLILLGTGLLSLGAVVRKRRA